MRGCWSIIIFSILTRITTITLWIFTPYVSNAFKIFIFPVIGILLLPTATLAYTFFYNFWQPGISPIEWILIVIALLVDLGSYGTTAPQYRKRFY